MRVPRSVVTLLGVAALGLGASAAYTVKTGDTLSGIAARLGVAAADLARANGISDANRIYAGQSLQLPGAAAMPTAAPTATTYVVATGDTLTGLARRFGVSVAALAQASGIDRRGILRVGTRLTVPTAAAPAASTTGYPSRLLQVPNRLALVPVFKYWAAANGIPADLLMAMTWLESGWQNTVVSPVGAVGIGQLMPATVEFVRNELIGVRSLDPSVPADNIRMTARYLRWLLGTSRGDVRLALAGYYQGPRSVRENGMLPVTVGYIDGVLAFRGRFAG